MGEYVFSLMERRTNMKIITGILLVLVAFGVCNAILEHLGIRTGQKFFKKPFTFLARGVLLPFELILRLVGICFLASPFDKEKRPKKERKIH